MKDIRVSVVCPLYEAERDILRLDESLASQEGAEIVEIFYVLTKSGDKTEGVMREAGILDRPEVRISKDNSIPVCIFQYYYIL